MEYQPDASLQETITDLSKTIYSYCRARTGSREEAEDLSQEILLELCRSVPSLREESAFYGFLWGVAGNVWRQWCKKKARPTASGALAELPESLSEDDAACWDEEQEEKSELFLLRRELALLNHRYRRATVLYYVENRSCAEIAERLGVSESMVKYLLFKSRQRLKEGMNMERKLGTLSYDPKTLIPMYSGTGPNRFWDFLKSKIRQNILSACYNDRLTEEQISLEIGIPVPYLEDDLRALEEKRLLLREGRYYKTNLVLLDASCREDLARSIRPVQEQAAQALSAFLDRALPEFRTRGYADKTFSDPTLRWQLASLVFGAAATYGRHEADGPLTAWGDSAWLWCLEDVPELRDSTYLVASCTVESRRGDWLRFHDYRLCPHGDHHDFYGADRKINLLCDLARGEEDTFSRYDLEIVAELLQQGYVRTEASGRHVLTMPVYTQAQYEAVTALAGDFVRTELSSALNTLTETLTGVLRNHVPTHLKPQVEAIARLETFGYFSDISRMLVERGVLSTAWNPLEQPTTYLILRA